MKKLYKKLITAFLFLFMVWVVISLITTYRLLHRANKKYVEKSAPSHMHGLLKPIHFFTTDSLRINGSMISEFNTNPFVLILHGNGSDFASNYELMDSLYQNNINSVAISLRTHGSSEGDINDAGFSAKYDVIAAVNFIRLNNESAKIVIASSVVSTM